MITLKIFLNWFDSLSSKDKAILTALMMFCMVFSSMIILVSAVIISL